MAVEGYETLMSHNGTALVDTVGQRPAADAPSDVAFVLVDDTGQVIATNDAMCGLLGRARDDLIGVDARAFAHGLDPSIHLPRGFTAWRTLTWIRADRTLAETDCWLTQTMVHGSRLLLLVVYPTRPGTDAAATRMSTDQKGDRMSTLDIWTYRSRIYTQHDLTGMSVEAIDGSIGKIDETTSEVGASYIVVDTGPWIFGKKVMLPAGVITNVDLDTETVFVNRTKDQIKNAPEYDETKFRDTKYRTSYQSQLGSYYGPRGRGYRQDPD